MSQIITNAFIKYWQACLADEHPVELDQMVLANLPDLAPDAPIDPEITLPDAQYIVHRHPIDQRGRINNDAVAYSIVMDTTVGDFEFNAMYLVNAATGMIAMAVHKPSETKLKTDEASGQTGNSLVKSMLMEYEQAAEATATHVDASTWQIDYAARLRGMDDDLRLQALQFFGPATFYGDGFELVSESGVYKVQPGVAYVGGLRAELAAERKIDQNAIAKPVAVWLDIYRAGSLLDAWVNHFTLTLSTKPVADYTDAQGYHHHVAKVATINADGSITDERRKRRLTLTGDVEGEGIMEDAKDVTVSVQIKDGSHRHPWSELDNVPTEATRWPSWGEVTDKPALAPQEHAHNYLTLRNLDWNTQTDAFMTGSAQAPKGSGSSEFLSWISWGHNGGSKFRHTLFSPTSAIRQLWYGFKANASDTTSPSTNARIYHTHDKPTPAELGAAPAAHSHPGSWLNPISLSTEDLDALTSPNVYAQNADANTSAARHYPENKSGSLTVTIGAGVQQRYHVYNSSRVWTRAKYGTTAWTTWAREYNTLNKPTPADVGLGLVSNKAANANAIADTYVLRDGSGDIQTRLVLSNYADQSSMSGAIAFRVNNGTDRYIRFCNNPASVRAWLGAPASVHTHTAAQANADIVASGHSQVGTYALLLSTVATDIAAGTTQAGSTLMYATCSGKHKTNRYATGTWKCVGATSSYKDQEGSGITLWLRVA